VIKTALMALRSPNLAHNPTQNFAAEGSSLTPRTIVEPAPLNPPEDPARQELPNS
jgi:hypothetical protein